ncbi:MAG TPA: hypothetical protein VF987_05990, partial [Rhodospirillales bacterium]
MNRLTLLGSIPVLALAFAVGSSYWTPAHALLDGGDTNTDVAIDDTLNICATLNSCNSGENGAGADQSDNNDPDVEDGSSNVGSGTSTATSDNDGSAVSQGLSTANNADDGGQATL